MPHCDEETLSLLALGESGPAAVEAHVAECERCGAELAALRRVVSTARSGEIEPDDTDLDDELDDELDDVPRIAPPSRVWDQIAAATGVQTAPGGSALTSAPESATAAATGPVAEPAAAPAPRPVRRASPAALPLQGSRWQTSRTLRLDRRLLAVAASCLVIGLAGGVLGSRLLSDGGESTPSAPVLAATRLAGLAAAPTASGQADVTKSAQGRTLDLDVRQLGVPDGFYEVWLIDPTVTKMVPVGVLNGAEGRFTLPAGVNLADYPVVDISIEPLDGNPAHSGKSVLRGTLQSYRARL